MHIGVCEYCGKEKEYKYKSWIKKYCSHRCSNMASKVFKIKKKLFEYMYPDLKLKVVK